MARPPQAFPIFRSPGTEGNRPATICRVAAGACLGAAFMGTIRMAPWFLMSFIVFGFLSRKGKRRIGWRRLLSGAEVMASSLIFMACLWPFSLGRYRPVDPEAYLSLDLLAHTLLTDVPLHDIWSLPLPAGSAGGGLENLDEAMRSYGFIRGTDRVALVGVMVAYLIVSRRLGWHDVACVDPEVSVRHRLSTLDGTADQVPPGTGAFVYYLDREALMEIQTCAGHAAYVYALDGTGESRTLYWAAYAFPVGWHTPLYMAAIDPIRRFIVFPSLLERFERAWRMRWVRPEGSP